MIRDKYQEVSFGLTVPSAAVRPLTDGPSRVVPSDDTFYAENRQKEHLRRAASNATNLNDFIYSPDKSKM